MLHCIYGMLNQPVPKQCLTRALQAGVYRLFTVPQVHLLQQITHLGGTGVILFHLLRLLIRKTKITEVLIPVLIKDINLRALG